MEQCCINLSMPSWAGSLAVKKVKKGKMQTESKAAEGTAHAGPGSGGKK